MVTRSAVAQATARSKGTSLAEQTSRDAASERGAEAVRRALSLVGPAEHSVERLADEPPVDEPAV